MRTLLLVLLVVLGIGDALAQDDAYHTWLRDHLAQEYDITGGAWSFGNTETSTLSLAQPSSGVTTQSFSTSDQVFTRALKLTVPQAADNPWDRTVRFHIQTPVSEGDVMLLCVWLRHVWPADDSGLVEPIFEIADSPYTKSLAKGFNLPGEWTLTMLPFESQTTAEVGGARFQLNMGRQRQITDLGGLALLNFGSSNSVDDLPTVAPPQTYGGRNPDAAWRAPAQERIEQFRMNDIEVTVVDESGQPVENAEVHVELKRHAFGFGTAISTGLMIGPQSNQIYREHVADVTGDGRTFNIAVLENALKWPSWEDDWPVSKNEKNTVVYWLISRGMDVRGHNLVWPQWQYLPEDIEQNQDNLDYVTERIRNHIHEVAGLPGLKGRIREWDVINEPVHTTDLRDIYRGAPGYPTGEEIYADWFRWAEEADPSARLFLNEYSIVNTFGPNPNSTGRPYYKSLIKGLLDAGVRFDGIGIQSHMSGVLTPIDTVYKVLDEFADFGLGISISEYDAPGAEPDLAADYMRDFLTIVFSHPAVESFLMWGFWDGAHWYDDAPIFREDWSVKPSGQVFLDLVFDTWWTDETAVTDSDGMVTFRGYHGDYDVTATHGGESLSADMTLAEGEPASVILSFGTTATEDREVGCPASGSDCRLQVEPNYPNPFSRTTLLSFTLPRPGDVRVRVYDVTGRQVFTHEVGLVQPGRHSVTLDMGHLPSGIYVYRMKAGAEYHTGYLSHLDN